MENPIARATMVVYRPVVRLDHAGSQDAILLAFLAMAVTIYPLMQSGVRVHAAPG